MPPRKKFELIDGNVEGGARTLYVYRDTGTGKADGSYLKKYSAKEKWDKIVSEIGGGAFILIERGGNRPYVRKKIIIPHEKATEAEVFTYDDDGDLLKRMERMIQLKAAANMLKPEMDLVTTLKTVMEIVNSSKGTQPATGDLFESFRDGIDFAGDLSGVPQSPEAILATSALRLAEKETTPAPVQQNTVPPAVARIAAALNKRVRILSKQVEELRTIKDDIEAIKTALARSTEPRGEIQQEKVDSRKRENIMNALTQFITALCEHKPETPEKLKTFFTLAEAKIPNLKTALKGIDKHHQEDLMQDVTEQIERVDLYEIYCSGLQQYITGT